MNKLERLIEYKEGHTKRNDKGKIDIDTTKKAVGTPMWENSVISLSIEELEGIKEVMEDIE